MNKLRRVETPEMDRLRGYLEAAQHAFIKGQYDVTLDAICFDILAANVTDEDVVRAVYSDFNPIEHRAECSLETMISGVQETLRLRREMWAPDFCNIPNIIEKNLFVIYGKHCGATVSLKTLGIECNGCN